MTTLVAWTGADSHGTASLYVASDSRASWDIGGGRKRTWDHCRKVFVLPGRPDVLAYCGPIVLLSHTLAALVDQIALGYVPYAPTSRERFQNLSIRLRGAHEAYPAEQLSPYTVLYATRDGEGRPASFHAFAASWRTGGWHTQELPAQRTSDIVWVDGSGADAASKWIQRWRAGDVSGRTSRSIFSGFCDSLHSGEDPNSGGAPQLAALYRAQNAEILGTIWRGARYLMGTPDGLNGVNPSSIEWRDNLFQRCDGTTLERLPNAKRHARPRALEP